MSPEAVDEGLAPTVATKGLSGVERKLEEAFRAEVGQLVLFPVTPEQLDRVEFRGVSGKGLEGEAPVLLGDELFDEAAAMGARPR